MSDTNDGTAGHVSKKARGEDSHEDISALRDVNSNLQTQVLRLRNEVAAQKLEIAATNKRHAEYIQGLLSTKFKRQRMAQRLAQYAAVGLRKAAEKEPGRPPTTTDMDQYNHKSWLSQLIAYPAAEVDNDESSASLLYVFIKDTLAFATTRSENKSRNDLAEPWA
jgi:hypothetical protein